jgi:hypothetical protein
MNKRSHKTVGIKDFLTIFAWWEKDPDPDPLFLPDPGGTLVARGNLETLFVENKWDEWEHRCREFEKHVKFVVKLVTILKVADLTQENVSCLNTSLVSFSAHWSDGVTR